MTTHSVALRHKLELIMPVMNDASRRLWSHPDTIGAYRGWLLALHGMIRATVPLMTVGLQHCAARPDDPVAKLLSRYLARHIRDEYGHDDWVRTDFLRAGGAEEEIDSFMPGPEIATLVGAQYYWMAHSHPVALMGHIAVLEGYPPSPQLALGLAQRTGLPAEAFFTIERHSTLDVKHRDELLSVLDKLPLTPWQASLVGSSALHTVRSVIDVVDVTLAKLPALTPA